MDGYVKNRTTMWVHAMKRTIGPGEMVPLETLYKQYGEKYGLQKGTEFVTWLRTIKLKDVDKWEIYLREEVISDNEDTVTMPTDSSIEKDVVEVDPEIDNKAIRDMDVKDVVLLSVRKAREIVPNIKDIKLLKYAFQEANQLAGKDSLCVLLTKQIKMLELRGGL